ncbi:hypothetical protein CALCODRAFT_178831 [Calocera cornea HHB12733]|uniref:Uncharacterized protein n=1 Tax=Calocera cornea HHB12733 TaxID=1353952 RepID=A0A165CDP4_9BASI|nr:hypothetical protein CALCODRAFT_178831 [Calocera cornea HHB12733]
MPSVPQGLVSFLANDEEAMMYEFRCVEAPWTRFGQASGNAIPDIDFLARMVWRRMVIRPCFLMLLLSEAGTWCYRKEGGVVYACQLVLRRIE